MTSAYASPPQVSAAYTAAPSVESNSTVPSVSSSDLDSWIQEARARAAEYLGMPESAYFLQEARRYLILKQLLDKASL